MILKIRINDVDEFQTYSINDAEICSESEYYGRSFIIVTFNSIDKIVEKFSLWTECYIIDDLKDVIYAIVPFSAAPYRNTIELTGIDSYISIDSTPPNCNYNYKIVADYYQVKRKENEEKRMKYYFYVRFANGKDSFSNSTTTYTYEVSRGYYEYYHVGDIINIREIKYENSTYTPNYSATSIRIEGKQSFVEDSIPERIKAAAIRYITKIEFIKQSTKPPHWFDNFIEKNKYVLELKNSRITDKPICYYREPKSGQLFTYSEIIEHHYSPLILKPSELIPELTADITDKQLKNMLANTKVQTPELNVNNDAPYVSATNTKNTWCPKTNIDLDAILSEADLEAILSEADQLKPWGFAQSTINQWCDLHLKDTKEKKMEEKEMTMFDNITKNMKFGKYEAVDAKYSINGIAFRDEKGGYFVYTDDVATDVTGMTIDMPLFCMPVALSQIAANDIILFKDKIVVVKEKTDDGIKIIYPLTSEIKVIIPPKSLFGFDYVTKIINPFEQFMTTASKDNPFGNFLPMMMFDDKVDDDSLMKIMMFSQMGQGDFMSNPMMMYMLMKDGKSNDFFLAMMLAKGGIPGVNLAQTKTE